MSDFDAIILGCGPAGERAAIQAARAGKRVAVLERHKVVGGCRINWGTIPSKTLRQSALFVLGVTRRNQEGFAIQIEQKISISEFMYRERLVVQRELELINRSLAKYAVEVFQGSARFVDPHTVTLLDSDGRSRSQFRGEKVFIATGSSPSHPDDVPFDGETIFDSDTILTMPRMPRSLIVLGAGVIGVEYAAIFAALGLAVTLVDTRDELLPYLDREVAGMLERGLRDLGMVIIHSDRHARIERTNGSTPGVRCTTTQGNVLEADALLYSVGRDGNTSQLGLGAVGITPDSRGLIKVNEHYQTSHPHIYAVGDVIGYPALASTSMEQGRQAARHAFGISGPVAAREHLPFAIYAIPEVSYVGATEEELQQQGIAYVVGRGRYDMNPRGQILAEKGGIKLLFEKSSRKLLGAHVVGHDASELIHLGQVLLRTGATPEHMLEEIYNYPTLSDLYRHAAVEALAELDG